MKICIESAMQIFVLTIAMGWKSCQSQHPSGGPARLNPQRRRSNIEPLHGQNEWAHESPHELLTFNRSAPVRPAFFRRSGGHPVFWGFVTACLLGYRLNAFSMRRSGISHMTATMT